MNEKKNLSMMMKEESKVASEDTKEYLKMDVKQGAYKDVQTALLVQDGYQVNTKVQTAPKCIDLNHKGTSEPNLIQGEEPEMPADVATEKEDTAMVW
jgi:hypothetical protein